MQSTRTENASALNLNSSVGREQFVAAGYRYPLAFKIMNKEILHTELSNFIKIAEENNIDFAKYTNDCSATKFVVKKDGSSRYKSRIIYDFHNLYRDQEYERFFPHYVLAILNKSYLMYELQNEISIWVCYTEEDFRENGYIEKLLKYLIEMYPEKRITIDTFNKSLHKTCSDLGINLFRQES